MSNNLSFYQALILLKNGKLATRAKWMVQKRDEFIFETPGDQIDLLKVLSIKSLPGGVKDYFELKYQPITQDNMPIVEFDEYLCLKCKDDTIKNGWQPSNEDRLASDWMQFNPDVIPSKKETGAPFDEASTKGSPTIDQGPKPSIGRIVHYTLDEEDVKSILEEKEVLHEVGKIVPALVVAVNEDCSIAAQVFLDGPNEIYFIDDVFQGNENGTWRWPQKV